MCFVIAGVQPKTRVLDQKPRRCPVCGLHQSTTRRVDHYFSLFFIPLVRVKKGEPFLFCQRCSRPVDEENPGICHRCGGRIRKDFNFCPHCGEKTAL